MKCIFSRTIYKIVISYIKFYSYVLIINVNIIQILNKAAAILIVILVLLVKKFLFPKKIKLFIKKQI
jgi:hypothetical protein